MVRLKIAVAGASGFIGAKLCDSLIADYDVVGLTRSASHSASNQIEWRACDLFSSSSTRKALEGVDVAIYLVHSMMPSSRLFQGSFHDTDLLLADNFARACATHSVQQIVYLGGLVPESGFVSKHLASRFEVEGVLQSSGVPVTCLRAGMVVGPGGSSFEILRTLVEKLPWMILPKWTQSVGQAVFVEDVVAVLRASILSPKFLGKTLNVVNGETLTYEMMLRQTAEALGKKRLMVRVPIASTGFSKRWVQLFSNASYELVSPLIDSLQCDLPQVQPGPEVAGLIRYANFASMMQQTLLHPTAETESAPNRPKLLAHSVRSVQRLPRLIDRDAAFISNEYMRWLPRFFKAAIRVTADQALVRFTTFFLRTPLLILEHQDGGFGQDRVKFHIVGGLLSKTTTTGWLEFRQVANRQYTLAAINEFVPSLPWLIYIYTQAPIHALVMHHFGRHISRLPASDERAIKNSSDSERQTKESS